MVGGAGEHPTANSACPGRQRHLSTRVPTLHPPAGICAGGAR